MMLHSPHYQLFFWSQCTVFIGFDFCGVKVNTARGAVNDPHTGNPLPYPSGLGPRKASKFMKAININGGTLSFRAELVGDAEPNKSKMEEI